MKKQLTLLALLFITLTAIQAQQNQIWSMPPDYVVNDGSGAPLLSPTALPAPNTCCPNIPELGYNGLPAQFSHNAMQDAAGNLLFFIVDGYVYDKNGNTIV